MNRQWRSQGLAQNLNLHLPIRRPVHHCQLPLAHRNLVWAGRAHGRPINLPIPAAPRPTIVRRARVGSRALLVIATRRELPLSFSTPSPLPPTKPRRVNAGGHLNVQGVASTLRGLVFDLNTQRFLDFSLATRFRGSSA